MGSWGRGLHLIRGWGSGGTEAVGGLHGIAARRRPVRGRSMAGGNDIGFLAGVAARMRPVRGGFIAGSEEPPGWARPPRRGLEEGQLLGAAFDGGFEAEV